MITNLFEGKNLTPKEILDNLEASNCGIEESHSFIRPYTEEELQEVEAQFLLKSKELDKLERDLKNVSNPIKEAMKPIAKETKRMVQTLNQGGTMVTDKVYCFPDYESKLMGLYDERGILIGTRQMTRAERQLHINSHLNINKAV